MPAEWQTPCRKWYFELGLVWFWHLEVKDKDIQWEIRFNVSSLKCVRLQWRRQGKGLLPLLLATAVSSLPVLWANRYKMHWVNVKKKTVNTNGQHENPPLWMREKLTTVPQCFHPKSYLPQHEQNEKRMHLIKPMWWYNKMINSQDSKIRLFYFWIPMAFKLLWQWCIMGDYNGFLKTCWRTLPWRNYSLGAHTWVLMAEYVSLCVCVVCVCSMCDLFKSNEH